MVTPAGIGLAAYLTLRLFPNAQGSGIPQAIAARHLSDQAARESLVSIRIAIGKMLLTLFGLLCGASAGREGPTVQVGASIMFALGRFSPRRQPGLILAGAAAGVAAAFNTPLVGIVFGIEEMSRAFETRTSGLIIAAVIAAGLTSLALVGNYAYFGSTPTTLARHADWLAVPLCGVIGGVAGGLFSRILIDVARLPEPARTRDQGPSAPVRHLLRPLRCDLRPDIGRHDLWYGLRAGKAGARPRHAAAARLRPAQARGHHFGRDQRHSGRHLLAVAGRRGGDRLQSLRPLPDVPLEAMMLLGMVSYFAGVVQAPITAVVIVAEMTDDHAMVIPLMMAAFVGWAASRLICHEGVYHALSRNFVAAAVAAGQHRRDEAPRQ